MRVIGLDPGLRRTGWGVIDVSGNRLRHVANGTVASDAAAALGTRLIQLYDGVRAVLERHRPDCAAVEQIVANRNGASTLKLGQARGVVVLAPALAGLPVHEYAANLVKKSVVGTGHAGKRQVAAMIGVLMPGCDLQGADAADALAVAVCHSHHAATATLWSSGAAAAAARAAANPIAPEGGP